MLDIFFPIMAETECSLLCWKGGKLQRLASSKIYIVMYGLVGFMQSSVNSYESAVLSTIEKRFQIPSIISGTIISGWDIGTCICVAYLAFSYREKFTSRSVSCGIFMTALCCALWYLPHAIYGTKTYQDSDIDVGEALKNASKCSVGLSSKNCSEVEESSLPIAIFLIANIIFGAGACFYWTVGLVYIDDNSSRNKVPLYLAITLLIRMMGPTFGYMLASYALALNADLSALSAIEKKDAKQIGAWWFGFPILFVILSLLSILMMSFPVYLPRAYQRKINSGENIVEPRSGSRYKDFRLMIQRLLQNKIFVYNTISSTLFVFGFMGFETFGPKYLEVQFQKSPSEASFITGSIGLGCTGLGFLVSGIVITYLKPNSRTLALWNVIAEMLDVFGHIGFAFLGCPIDASKMITQVHLEEECNMELSCPSKKYSPLCSQYENKLFYSPCHAGCHPGSLDEALQIYFNCTCSPSVPLTVGPCPGSGQCNTEFYMYVAIVCILKFLSSSGRAGNTILQFRSVRERDKMFSIGFTEAIMSLFGFIPSPIIFGHLIDSTCGYWAGPSTGGGKGNCWLYDGRPMRYVLNFTTAGFLCLGTLADLAVWFYSEKIEIYEKEETELPITLECPVGH